MINCWLEDQAITWYLDDIAKACKLECECLISICYAGYQSDASSSTIGGSSSESQPKKGSLREYVDKFSPETVQEMARVVSQEAAHLIDMQTLALFGDYRQLQEQMKVSTAQPS